MGCEVVSLLLGSDQSLYSPQGLLQHHYSREGDTLLLLGGRSNPCSSDTGSAVGEIITAWQGWKTQFHFGILWNHHGRDVGVPCYTLANLKKSRRPTLPLLAVFRVVFGWSRVVTVSMFSAFLGCPFPGHLTRELRLFLGLFCLCLWCFQVASFFSSNSVMNKK